MFRTGYDLADPEQCVGQDLLDGIAEDYVAQVKAKGLELPTQTHSGPVWVGLLGVVRRSREQQDIQIFAVRTISNTTGPRWRCLPSGIT